jgi:hypothetical protein
MDARTAMVRFCPVNDPDWESSGYPRLDDRWDCETRTIAWKLA